MNLAFTESDWKRIESDWTAWWAGDLDRPLVVLECIERLDAYDPHCASVFLTNYPLDQPVAGILDEFMPRLENTHYLGDAFPRFWPNFGPGIVAAFAGATVQPRWDTTWFTPSQGGSISDLHVVMDWNCPWWQRVCEFTHLAVERWGGQLAVGLTDLGGNLDILASLRGTKQLLIDLVRTPAEVERLVAETTRAWLECYDRLANLVRTTGKGITCWGPLWSPGDGYMLQSDFSYMVSPAMFRRFALPDLSACAGRMECAFYHMDGIGQLVHLDDLLSIPDLKGIQWVPGYGKPACEEWLEILAKIRAAGKSCQVTVSPQGAMRIMKALGGKGFCFVISEPQLTPAEGKAFLEELAITGQ